MTPEDRIWDNGWGKALIYFAEMEEQLRRECVRRGLPPIARTVTLSTSSRSDANPSSSASEDER